MANMQKYNRAQVGHLFLHYERGLDKDGNLIKYGNKDIDSSKSFLNYNLAPDHNMSQYEFMKKRIKEVKCLNRKDVITACDWVITAPKELPPDQHRYFFETTYNFLVNKYGKENMISAWVHNDEGGRPHIHVCHVPVLDAVNKKGISIQKVCAKELYTRKHLLKFHNELQRAVDTAGLNCKVKNDITKTIGKNLTVSEIKQMPPNTLDDIIISKKKISKAQKNKEEFEAMKQFLNSHVISGGETLMDMFRNQQQHESEELMCR